MTREEWDKLNPYDQWIAQGQPSCWYRLKQASVGSFTAFLDEDRPYGILRLTVIDHEKELILSFDNRRLKFVPSCGFTKLSTRYYPNQGLYFAMQEEIMP